MKKKNSTWSEGGDVVNERPTSWPVNFAASRTSVRRFPQLLSPSASPRLHRMLKNTANSHNTSIVNQRRLTRKTGRVELGLQNAKNVLEARKTPEKYINETNGNSRATLSLSLSRNATHQKHTQTTHMTFSGSSRSISWNLKERHNQTTFNDPRKQKRRALAWMWLRLNPQWQWQRWRKTNSQTS